MYRLVVAFLALSSVFVTLGAHPIDAQQTSARSRPNVILILADDLGYETLGANGGQSYATPQLDRLAARGARFEHCYVQPLCTPTRVQLMTGLYNVRNYVGFGQITPDAQTFAHLFRDAGYATCMVGKWQLGHDPQLPSKLGFQEYYLWQHTRRPPRYANPGLEINGKEVDFTGGEYGPDLLNQYAIDFIRRHQNQEFFLYYSMTLTHAPYQPTPDSPDWDPTARGENVNRDPKHFADMVTYMDKLVGKLCAELEHLGLEKRTIVVFLGDNGTGQGIRSRWQGKVVRGGKGKTTWTGMRVPCIVAWPGIVPAGQVVNHLVDSTDFLPTLCEAAGIAIPKDWTIDGRSFWPLITNQPGEPRAWIYSWYSPRGEPPKEFVFNHRYKLYRTGEFYDLAADPDEEHPLKVQSLNDQARTTAELFLRVLGQFEHARPQKLQN
ncbi:MAG: arylsulfatase [Pirellulaceae bacterium]|nr:MAG: arylsulfatase [Pirellulaceae bacterium]